MAPEKEPTSLQLLTDQLRREQRADEMKRALQRIFDLANAMDPENWLSHSGAIMTIAKAASDD